MARRTPRTRRQPAPRTAWHPMLVVAIEDTLDPKAWQVFAEFLLGKEPQRADVMVVRRQPGAPAPAPPPRLRTVLDELLDHNLVHFKGPTDALDRDDAVQVLSYASQYMLVTRAYDPASVGVRVVAPSLTAPFREQVRALGGTLAPSPREGVHEGALGPFRLRVVETSVACKGRHERVLYAFSPGILSDPSGARDVDDAERRLYLRLYRCIEQLFRSPGAAMTRDARLAYQSFEKVAAEVLPHLPPKLLRKLTPEQIAQGLTPEQLAALTPEQRLAGLSEAEQVLALPDAALRALSKDYVATLPSAVRKKIRQRIGD